MWHFDVRIVGNSLALVQPRSSPIADLSIIFDQVGQSWAESGRVGRCAPNYQYVPEDGGEGKEEGGNEERGERGFARANNCPCINRRVGGQAQ
jgi:hypothetical protein